MNDHTATEPPQDEPAVGAQVDRRVMPLVERLGMQWPEVACHRDILHREAAAEIERLTKCLKDANDQAERFERGWYLRGDALEKLQAWADAYPLKVFPEPDMARAHELLTAGGMTLDAISASNMRHVIDGVRELVAEGLAA